MNKNFHFIADRVGRDIYRDGVEDGVGQRRINAEAASKAAIQIFDAGRPQIAADVHNQRCHGREHAEGQGGEEEEEEDGKLGRV